MASFYIPLTGLNADSTALNTIANNLSNMNTTGFKSKSVNFSDLFYQQIGEAGSGDPIQRGSGTQVCSIETDFSNGSPNTTNVDTNVALQGNGFFVVGSGNDTLLTRDGDFSLDLNGNLITSSGLNVMGFPAANGVVNTNAPLAPVHIPVGEVEPPSATTSFGMTATLNSAANVGDSLSGKIQVYDSLGNAYQAQVTYTKTATNTWSYNVTLPGYAPGHQHQRRSGSPSRSPTLRSIPSAPARHGRSVYQPDDNGTKCGRGFNYHQRTRSSRPARP